MRKPLLPPRIKLTLLQLRRPVSLRSNPTHEGGTIRKINICTYQIKHTQHNKNKITLFFLPASRTNAEGTATAESEPMDESRETTKLKEEAEGNSAGKGGEGNGGGEENEGAANEGEGRKRWLTKSLN